MTAAHDPYRIACIICTYQRPNLLTKALRSLKAQSIPANTFEVIVVDNQSGDDTPQIVKQLGDEVTFKLRYVLETRPGLSYARNAGARAANAPWLAFLDDDAQADTHWLEQLIQTFESQPEAGVIGGPIRGDWQAPRPLWLSDDHLPRLSLLDLGPEGHFLAEDAMLFGANLALRRATLEALGGFDTELGRRGLALGANEDTDIQKRSRQAGWGVYYEPNALVYHLVPAERLQRMSFYRRAFGGARSEALIYARQRGRTWLMWAGLRKSVKALGLSAMAMMNVFAPRAHFARGLQAASEWGYAWQYARLLLNPKDKTI